MRLNIYISFDTRQRIDETMKKYHVSMGCLVRILTEEMMINYFMNLKRELDIKYLDQHKRAKTSTNLRKEFYEELVKMNAASKSILVSNILYIYYNFEKDENIKTLFPEIQTIMWNKIKSKVGNRLANEREVYWDYNHQMRCVYRARKQYDKEHPNEQTR